MGACLYGVFYFASALPQIFFPTGDSGFMQGVFIQNTKDFAQGNRQNAG